MKKICGNATTPGQGESNAWGDNHLWVRHRQGSSLSRLAEPRIPARKRAGSVNLLTSNS